MVARARRRKRAPARRARARVASRERAAKKHGRVCIARANSPRAVLNLYLFRTFGWLTRTHRSSREPTCARVARRPSRVRTRVDSRARARRERRRRRATRDRARRATRGRRCASMTSRWATRATTTTRARRAMRSNGTRKDSSATRARAGEDGRRRSRAWCARWEARGTIIRRCTSTDRR